MKNFISILTLLILISTAFAAGNFDAAQIKDGTFTSVKFSSEVYTYLKTTTEVESIIDDYSYNSTEVYTTSEVYMTSEVYTTAEVDAKLGPCTTTTEVESIIDDYSYNSTEVYTKLEFSAEVDAVIDSYSYNSTEVYTTAEADIKFTGTAEVESIIDDYSYNSTEVYTKLEFSAEVDAVIDSYSYNSTEVYTTAEADIKFTGTAEVESIIDDYSVNSTEVILKDGTVSLSGDWNAGNDLYNVTGIKNLLAGTVAVNVSSALAKVHAETTDYTSIAGLFGDDGAGEGDSTYIVGNSLNSGYSQNTDLGGLWLNYRGYQNGTTKYRDLYFGDGKENAVMFLDGSIPSVALNAASLEVKASSSNNNSPYLTLTGNNGGTEQRYKFQTCYGADPYLRMFEDNTVFFNFQNNRLYPETNNSVDLGIATTNEFKNVYLAGNAVIGTSIEIGTAYITKDGTSQLILYDSTTGAKTLAQLAAGTTSKLFVESFSATGASNDFVCSHEPFGDSVDNVQVFVGGSLQPYPGTNYTYTAGTDTITISGALLSGGVVVTLIYNY